MSHLGLNNISVYEVHIVFADNNSSLLLSIIPEDLMYLL